MAPSLTLRLGNLYIRFHATHRRHERLIRDRYAPFIVRKPATACADVVITDIPPARRAALSVRSIPGGWEIRRTDFLSLSDQTLAHTVLSVEADRYSFDSWFRVFITLLALRQDGFLIHGAGILRNAAVHIFAGRSGKGKSTITRKFGKARALSDELTLVYRERGDYFAASTPFWGELKRGTGAVFTGPLEALNFIEHGPENDRTALPAAAAVRDLLSTVLFFARDDESVGRLFDAALSLIRRVPAYRLPFRKDSTAAELSAVLEKEKRS